MDEPDVFQNRSTEPDPERRALLTGLTAAYLVSYVPSALAHLAQKGDASARDAFMAVSRILTGRANLDVDQATRLYDALAADVTGFPADVQALIALIEQRKIDPGQLQQVLDGEQSPLTGLPRTIVKAWYTGIVGEAERARCVTFETSLMYVAVADRLNPPSYCTGSYGSWMDKPA